MDVLIQLWWRLWLDALRSEPVGLSGGYCSNPYELRDRWLARLSRVTLETMKSPAFMVSMARGLLLMTQAAELGAGVPFSRVLGRIDRRMFDGYRSSRIS
jgi:hypothetical protein